MTSSFLSPQIESDKLKCNPIDFILKFQNEGFREFLKLNPSQLHLENVLLNLLVLRSFEADNQVYHLQ
ncbi:hypothetical protein TNCT_289531 [Trichonephila clavata]|uniref:Uncharacterized protein n=1 Tax=Trichonephila clavata TaxID=2740835 RepID=A0A8X6LS53_TRICU|nr:hypothetical protein TNCT_289531 [Trichonephila clavata]